MAKTEWKLSCINISSCQSFTSNWNLQVSIIQQPTSQLININTTAIPEFAAYVQNQTVRQCTVTSRRNTKKQAWISNVVTGRQRKPHRRVTYPTLDRGQGLCAPGTSWRCSCYSASIWQSRCGPPSASIGRCCSISLSVRLCHEPTQVTYRQTSSFRQRKLTNHRKQVITRRHS